MRRLVCGAAAALAALAALADTAAPPAAPARPVRDTYFGIEIEDQYRYFERSDDPEVADWTRAQSSYARQLIDSMPGREALLARLRALDAEVPETVNALEWRPGDLVFYQKLSGGDRRAKLYVRHGIDGPEHLVVDPEALPPTTSQQIAPTLRQYEASPSGRYVALELGPKPGTTTLVVIETRTGRVVLGPTPGMVAAPIGWLPDDSGLFATRLRGSALESVLLRIGADPQHAASVLGAGTPGTSIDPIGDRPVVVTLPGTTIAAGIVSGDGPDLDIYLAPLDSLLRGRPRWRRVIDRHDQVVASTAVRDRLFLLSHFEAPRGRVLEIPAAATGLGQARIVMEESDSVVQQLVRARDALYATRRDGMITHLWRIGFEPDAAPTEIGLPFAGAARIVAADPRVPGVLVAVESWLQPRRIVRVDGKRALDTDLLPVLPVPTADYIATDVQVAGQDGVRVPMSIISRRDLAFDSTNPTLLTAYGAFGRTLEPSFDPYNLAWLERGGVIAVANPRGSGAYGDDWHRAGIESAKPNGWRDFLACAQYLIDQRVASPATLGIEGSNAGAILVGRAITERPDLFAAAVSRAGRLDTVRSALLTGKTPSGEAEFGAPASESGLRALLEMSTYAQIRDGVKYPAVLLDAAPGRGPRDAGAVPLWNSTKTAARLQQASTSGKPVLLLTEPASPGAEARADALSFLLWQFGVPQFEPKH